MAAWQDSLAEWTQSWNATGGPERVVAIWPGDATGDSAADPANVPANVPAEVTVVVSEDPAAATAALASAGRPVKSQLKLVVGQAEDQELAATLPENSYVALAPMDTYDAVEVAIFDRPVARGRMNVGEGLAVMAHVSVDEDQTEIAGPLEFAMIDAVAEEAFLHGADLIFFVATTEQAERLAGEESWENVATLLLLAEDS